MLQKNPTLTQAQVESILKSSALAISPGSATVRWPSVTNYSNAGNGNEPTWEDHDRVSISSQTFSWGSDATGAGLVLAGAALAATPDP
jgi:hypothetical protein